MNPPKPPVFVWDTSALIAAWVERYPPDVLPRLWERFVEAIQTGRMFAPDEVRVELEKRSSDLLEFLKPHEGFFIPTDEATLATVSAILSIHPKLVMERKRSSAADPFVIAAARLLGGVVVTEEGRGSPARPKITDICDAYNVRCFGLLELIRECGWKF